MSETKNTTNLVIYLDSGQIKVGKKEVFYAGCHGYTYDIGVEGKKKLQKDVATSNGYYTGNPQRGGKVIDIIDIISVNAPNATSELESLMLILNTILTEMADDLTVYKNLCVITKNANLERVFGATYEMLTKDKFNVGRIQLSEGEQKLLKEILNFKDALVANGNKFIFDLDASVEGGKGNKMCTQQTGLSQVISMWSDETIPTIAITPRKEYENPETDFNKLVSASRWYFNTGEGTDFYDEVEGYRVYDFGKVEPDKKYYGKLVPDVTYSKLYTKTPLTVLDKLFEYTKGKIKNPSELLSAGILTNVKSKDLARLIDTYPGIKDKQNLVMPYQVGGKEDPVLVELIDPPMLSYRVKECLANMDVIFDAFMNRDENNKHKVTTFYDITDKVFTKETNKKDVVKVKMHDDFKQNTPSLLVNVEHPSAVKPVKLIISIGFDIPERNALNTINDPDVEVWVAVDTQNKNGLRYCTITKAEDFIYVHTSGIANLRVLSLAELGRKA